jgi:hypothetical protein
MSDDLHAFFRRSEARRQEFGFSFLLDNADTTSAEGDEPAIMAERGNSNPDRLGSFKDRAPLFDLYSDVIDLQFDGLICHKFNFKCQSSKSKGMPNDKVQI